MAFILLLAFSFSVTLLGIESAQVYFPGTLESFWVYEDQDGNELTRVAIEGEEIAGKTYPAFSYEPELEDWVDYSCFIHPSLYNVSDAGITLVVGEEVENGVKARLKKEMDMFAEVLSQEIVTQLPPGVEIPNINLDVDVEAEAHDHLFLLPDTITINEEWDVNQIEVKAKIIPEGLGDPDNEQLTVDFTIVETGIVLGTETVETIAGRFEDCLKVEYRTETSAVMMPNPPPDEVNPPGETVTTVWFAPKVGIVKLHQKSGYMFLDMIPADVADFPVTFPPPTERTLELKRYEIKTAE